MSELCPVSGCGTGEWSGPLPGDPDNNITLTATAAYGGINVNWTYPTLNGHAVIHTYLYRGITSDFNLSVRRAIVSGNSYYDRIPKAEIRQYYYWIQVVSVNGTVGDTIGPASATPLNAALETLEDLTGLIDEGVLAQHLKEKIERVSSLGVGLDGEIINRIREYEALSEALDYVLAKSDAAIALIVDETTQRVTADEGFTNSLNVLAVGLNSNAAAIVEEKTVRVTKDDAFAHQINILYTETANNTSAISTEQTTRTDQNQAITALVTNVVATTGQLGAAVQANATAITDAKSSFSQQLTTAQSLFGNQLASVQTSMTTSINAVDNKASALYSAKVDVNGLIGGFGIYNNSQFVEAGFDVDRFWIGRTYNKVKPFVIENGTVYINHARVNTLSIEGNAVTVPIGGGFGSTTNASLGTSSIPAGTPCIVTVSWSNPLATSHLTITGMGTTLCNSDITYGASSFSAFGYANGGNISVSFTTACHGVFISVIGCKR